MQWPNEVVNDERKRKHFNENRNKYYCFPYAAATFFNNKKRASCLLTKFNTKSVCSFSPLQTLPLIYHLFTFPTTHFPLIALKPTDEKESFSLLALVFDGLYKRLFLILCKDITLIMRVFFCFSQSDTIADRSCPSVSDRLDPPTFHTLCKDIILLMCLFSKSLAIGLPASGVSVLKDRWCPSVSDRLDPPTFHTLPT